MGSIIRNPCISADVSCLMSPKLFQMAARQYLKWGISMSICSNIGFSVYKMYTLITADFSSEILHSNKIRYLTFDKEGIFTRRQYLKCPCVLISGSQLQDLGSHKSRRK